MLVLTAPEPFTTFERPSIFLGGAITDAPCWQLEAIELLRPCFATCFNPRRPLDFRTPDQPDYLADYREQVSWEHRAILVADIVLFWMPAEALAITTRFEIGWLYGLRSCADHGQAKRFAVGIEEGVRGDTYYRVVLPDIGVPVHTTLAATCAWAAEMVSP